MRSRNRRRATTDAHQLFLDTVGPHLDVLRSIAGGLVRSPHAADDLFQDTCMRAFAGFDGWRGGDTRSWLVAIMMNSRRMDSRRAQSRPVESFGDVVDEPCRRPSVEDLAIAAVDRDRVLEALDLLPEEQRVCVVLMDLGGCTAQEVADVLGCPRGTVLARVHRARRKVAATIDARVGAA
ncbi:MAG: RNA polymerase sigma factor [Actinobacteria bacterium]|nr:RNA polymerase sigma factor [Actinomycetota bacterium]